MENWGHKRECGWLVLTARVQWDSEVLIHLWLLDAHLASGLGSVCQNVDYLP